MFAILKASWFSSVCLHRMKPAGPRFDQFLTLLLGARSKMMAERVFFCNGFRKGLGCLKVIIFFYVLLPCFIFITPSIRISLQRCLVQRIRQVSSSSRSWSTMDPHLWYILTQAWLKSTMFPYYDHFNSDHLVISTFQHAANFFPTATAKSKPIWNNCFSKSTEKGQTCSSFLYVLEVVQFHHTLSLVFSPSISASKTLTHE